MSALTVGQALAAFQAANRIDPAATAAPTWSVRIGPLTMRFSNYRWRRQTLAAHDLHHVLTGYSCTLRGEFEMAAWEAASGGFPNAGAAAVCGGLIVAGLIACPRRTLRAWRRGRASRNLHRAPLVATLLARPLPDLRRERAPNEGNA